MCGELVIKGFCQLHVKRGAEKQRGNSTERGYDWKWRKFRERYLRQPENAVCKDCERRPATDVHHIKKLADFPHLKYELTNLKGLCSECHDKLTAAGF